MESWEAIAISQALRLGQFWHACNMPLTAHRHVNGKPLKIGINWRKFVPFHPLDLQKTAHFIDLVGDDRPIVWLGLVASNAMRREQAVLAHHPSHTTGAGANASKAQPRP